ncbi:MAG: ABC transporter ATP-binding protein [Caldilineaceae bacterium SB0664_bin_27]|uniref:ABC transporter ATP-binding protein n=1 Tax=Caldilineaceae bacterium SB0664_bin_27 TaxID=2605260 RepID=A0A6B0YNS4_9CHLR|nr:ABC transporter ATP-binding protein [Caldilineaceae bacterium SB0664_bin_27]
MDTLLEVRDLQTHFFMTEGIAKAVDSTTFSIRRGQVLGVVGESGCGKSVTARSIMRMVRPPGHTVDGEILYTRPDDDGQSTVVDLLQLPATGTEMRAIRGGEIAMIFQEPRASLSPVHKIGDQIAENILLHQPVSQSEAEDIAIDMLRQVHIPLAEQRMDAFAHQLSGGMCQRVMIAMALSCHPSLLIADEPTTALDVTTEAQILELMQGLQAELNMAIMFITHDLGVVADMADEVAVMYLGKIVEQGAADDIFRDPKHPYTIALLESLPRMDQKREWLQTIRGVVPDPYSTLKGCPFHPRCADFIAGVCDEIVPQPITLEDNREVRCLLYTEHAHQDSPPVAEETGHQ